MSLIPRDVLFGAPDKSDVQISPDGKYISYIALHEGVKNIWVVPVDNLDQAVCVTEDKTRGISHYHWTYLAGTLVFLQDQGGNENFGLYMAQVDGQKTKCLINYENTRVEIVKLHFRSPSNILIAMNKRDPKFMDYHIINLETCAEHLIYKNEEEFAYLIFDSKFAPRLAFRENKDASVSVYSFDGDSKKMQFDQVIPFEDSMATACWGIYQEDQYMVWADSRGGNTAVLKAIHIDTREEKILASNEKADVCGMSLHPQSERLRGVRFDPGKSEWIFLDSEFESHMKILEAKIGGGLDLTPSLDDKTWLISSVSDVEATRYFLYEPKGQRITFLFATIPQLDSFNLCKTEVKNILSRDGYTLVSYLTLPKKPLSGNRNAHVMVLRVHGGPWSRDIWEFNPMTQLLADRGYAVLSVNFRGSTGFGKKLVNAADGEWGGRMQEDLIDACRWAIQAGIADPDKIAIMGASYGGYAALLGLTLTPGFFACAVDVVGPSNINTLLDAIPSYWESMRSTFKKRVGDFETPEGRKFLEERSPLSYVDRIRKPLLILQGANDPRVKQEESRQIYQAMKKKSIPVEYIVFSDEGHGFVVPKNRVAYIAIVEEFLSRILGGRLQEAGEDIKNSSATVY